MSRLRQQNPQNYVSSANISAEFENVIRYLNSAELGNKTLSELMAILFDEDGEFAGPIEFRMDSSDGLQYRVGEYDDAEDGWETIADLEDLRGPAGRDVGDIGAPILFGRTDTAATSGQTEFAYAHDDTDELLVYVDGVLQREGGSYDYTHDADAGTVTFNSGLTTGEVVTIYKVRATAITGYTRSDTVTAATQAVFPFEHDDTTVLQVYKNGILQRAGGSYDYTSDAASNTITFMTPVTSGNLVTIITVENTATTAVTGLMMEENFCDSATGKILYANVQVADGDITQAKVSGLVSHIATAAKLTVAGTTPTGPASGNLWLDTSQTPNVLKFYNGSDWLPTSPESGLPSYTTSDAGKAIFVNSFGTGLEYDDIDLSSRIAVTARGAANGVASLDSTGRLPAAQLPEELSSESYYSKQAGATADATYLSKRIFKQRVELTAVSIQCSAGTCTLQLAVNGVGVGSTYAVTTAGVEATLATPQEVDARSTNARIGYIVTAQSSLADLEVTIAAVNLSN